MSRPSRLGSSPPSATGEVHAMNAELKELLENLEKTIVELMDILPDSVHEEDCWNWCWNELTDDAQVEIKSVRKKAKYWLDTIRRFTP